MIEFILFLFVLVIFGLFIDWVIIISISQIVKQYQKEQLKKFVQKRKKIKLKYF